MAAFASANSISALSRRRRFSWVPFVASAVMCQPFDAMLEPTTSAMALPTTKKAPPGGAVPILRNCRWLSALSDFLLHPMVTSKTKKINTLKNVCPLPMFCSTFNSRNHPGHQALTEPCPPAAKQQSLFIIPAFILISRVFVHATCHFLRIRVVLFQILPVSMGDQGTSKDPTAFRAYRQ
jgi:hypothetical protein